MDNVKTLTQKLGIDKNFNMFGFLFVLSHYLDSAKCTIVSLLITYAYYKTTSEMICLQLKKNKCTM